MQGQDKWKAPLLDVPSRENSLGTLPPLRVGAGDGRSVASFERHPRGAAVHRTGRGGFSGDKPKITKAVSIPDTAPQPALSLPADSVRGATKTPGGDANEVHTRALCLIQALWVQSLGGTMTRAAKRGAIAGVAVAAIAVAAVLFAVGGRSTNAAAQSGLTVNLPPAASDHIYASPAARGRPVVVIDAGHGGRDPGATSVSGQVREKQLTLILAQALRDELVKRGRVRVAMTRDDDRYLTLDNRAAVARRLNAAMFVSVHIDSAANPLARGASVYSLSDVASDADAAGLAARENGQSGPAYSAGSAEGMLADLAMRSQM